MSTERGNEKEQALKTGIEYLLGKIGENPYFSKSIPAFDDEFLRVQIIRYGYNAVALALNEVYGWVLEDPLANERTNYRKTLGSWLKKNEVVHCPKCGYNIKRSGK